MIGDVLTTSILFEVLRKKFPDAKLHYLINSHTFPVVENNPFIDKMIYFSPEIEKSYLKFYSFLKEIRKERYDVVIDVYGKLSSNLVTLLSGAENRIGYHKKYSSKIFNQPIKRISTSTKNVSLAVENRLRLLQPLDIEFEYVEPKIYLKEQEIDSARKMLEANSIDLSNPIFMISVLGSDEKKTYPPEYMAQLLDIIVEQKPDAQLLFNYIPKQEQQARDIFNITSAKTKKQIFFDIYGKSLREFLAITAHCNAVIGNEGGAINMAKALNKPTFIIFSPHIGKGNWYGNMESKKHIAVHLSDYTSHTQKNIKAAQSNPLQYYQKLTPDLISPTLIKYLANI